MGRSKRMNLKMIKRELGTIAVFIALVMHNPEVLLHVHGMLHNRISRAFIAKLGLSKEEQRELRRAILIHDVGKLAVSRVILNSCKPLSEAEYDEIKRHAWIGEEIAEALGYEKAVTVAVRQHHERIDGNGYPDHLTGDKISYYAKVIALLDSFDVMRRGRIYRCALKKDEIIRDLSSERRPLFDKEMAEILIEIIKKEL